MKCKQCNCEMYIDEWNGWYWQCMECDYRCRANESEIQQYEKEMQEYYKNTLKSPKEEYINVYYLSGAMTNTKRDDYNYEEFNRVTALLRDDGYDIINPVELDDGTMTKWEDFLIRDISYLLKNRIRNVILLPNWTISKGSCLEVFNVINVLKGKCYLFTENQDGYTLTVLNISNQYIIEQMEKQNV